MTTNDSAVCAETDEALLWVLQYTRMALRNSWLKLASLKADNLAESRSSKVLSWGQVSVLKWWLLCHLKGTLPGLTEDDSVSQDLVKVVDTCLVIPHFEALLPQKDVPDLDKQQELAVQAADDDADMPEAASQLNEGAELLQGFLNGLSSAGRAAGNLLFDLLQGDLENEFQAVWLGSENYEKTLKAILANEEQEEENSWTQAVSNLMSELELLHAQKTQADPTLGAPAPKLRELVRLNSDENGADQIAKCKKERETLWTSCVQHRSRTVRFLVGQKKNSMQLLEAIQCLFCHDFAVIVSSLSLSPLPLSLSLSLSLRETSTSLSLSVSLSPSPMSQTSRRAVRDLSAQGHSNMEGIQAIQHRLHPRDLVRGSGGRSAQNSMAKLVPEAERRVHRGHRAFGPPEEYDRKGQDDLRGLRRPKQVLEKVFG